MLSGGSGDQNLAPIVTTEDGIEELLARVRSLLVFSVENKGPKVSAVMKKSDVMSERWKNIFMKYDSEGTGTLHLRDIKKMVRKDLKISERLVSDQAIGSLFAAIDEDGGGSVEFDEFLHFIHTPSTRGTITDEEVVNSVARSVRLALHRNKICVSELESNFRNFEESGDIATGELDPNDMARFFRRVLKLSKHECSDKALRVAFQYLDDDGSGTMSLDEFMEFIKFCCLEHGKTPLPSRVPGLIGGMRGELPMRSPTRRPGTLPGSPKSHVPFCLNGRDVLDNGRLGSSARPWIGRSDTETSLHTLGFRTSQSLSKHQASSASLPTYQECDSEQPSPKPPIGVGSCTTLKSEGEKGVLTSLKKDPQEKKRVWNGKLPSKTCGGYVLLKGAHALNKVEQRLFEAGIDVRGNYHKLGRDRPGL